MALHRRQVFVTLAGTLGTTTAGCLNDSANGSFQTDECHSGPEIVVADGEPRVQLAVC